MYFTESIPDCVPEFYRSRQEAADHGYECEMQKRTHFLANREKISAAIAAGLPVLTLNGCGPCWECGTADHDTRTDDDDDFDRVVCLNPACRYNRRDPGGNTIL